MDVAEMTPSEAKSALVRARTYLQKAKANNEQVVGRMTVGAMVMAGGVAAAVFDSKMPVVPGTAFPMKVAVGGLCAAVGLADGAGKFSDQLAGLGFGLLSSQAEASARKALAA